MDERRFDDLARALGAGLTRRGLGAAAALAGAAGIVAALTDEDGDAASKRRDHGPRGQHQKRKCRRTSPAGQCCRRDGTCTCSNGGTVCGTACCTGGQTCESGTCRETPQCLALGTACKGTGRTCCAGLRCGSGQGGTDDIGCWVPAGGRCAGTAECAWLSTCQGGACVEQAPPPPPTVAPEPTQPSPPPQPTPTATAVTPSCTVTDTGNAATNGTNLQAAITNAAEYATVTVAPGTYETSGGFIVSKPITIRRCFSGTVILRGITSNKSVVRAYDTGVVELDGLTITTATGVANGVGIEVGAANPVDTSSTPHLTLRNCTVTANTGGGIHVWGQLSGSLYRPVLRVVDSSITNNRAVFSTTTAGGGITAERARVEISGSTITDNWTGSATSTPPVRGFGGGIHLFSTQLTVRGNSAITGNHAYGGTLTINSYNLAGPGGGGGIGIPAASMYGASNEASRVVIEAGSTVTGNEAHAYNSVAGQGGGAYGYGSLATGSSVAAGAITGNTPDNCYNLGVTCT